MHTPGARAGSRGFTLLEMILVIAFTAILFSVGGMGLTQGVQAYFLASENVNLSQKAQMALVRIDMELGDCRDCTPLPDACVALPFDFRNDLGARRIDFQNGEIRLGDPNGLQTLLDQVDDFCLWAVAGETVLEVRVTLDHRFSATDQAFRKSVHYRR